MMILVLPTAFDLWKNRRATPQIVPENGKTLGYRTLRRESHIMFWLALGFLGTKVLLVILVQPANSRYMTGASCLVPAVFAVWTAHACQRIGHMARGFPKERESHTQ
jgi:hypothetical protein